MSVASLSLSKTDWMHTRNSQRVISINFIFLWIWNEIFTEQICCTLVNIWRCILTQDIRHSNNRVSKTGNDDQRLLLHICQQQTLVIYSSTLAWKHLNYWGSSRTLPELKHYTQYFYLLLHSCLKGTSALSALGSHLMREWRGQTCDTVLAADSGWKLFFFHIVFLWFSFPGGHRHEQRGRRHGLWCSTVC